MSRSPAAATNLLDGEWKLEFTTDGRAVETFTRSGKLHRLVYAVKALR